MVFCNRARQRDSKSGMGNSGGRQSESKKLNSLSPGHLTLILNAADLISQPNTHESLRAYSHCTQQCKAEQEVDFRE